MPNSPLPSKNRPQRRGVNPWLPNQHGAWAMLLLPLIVGFVLGMALSPSPILLLTIAAVWIFGYFMFFAFDLWFKARNPRRKAEYLRPMLTYGAIAAVAGVAVLFMKPSMLWWVPVFVPLVTWAFVEIFRRRPRSLSSGISTTLASSLMIPVMVSAASAELPEFFTEFSSEHSAEVALVTLAVAAYFVGTIPYVKTLIRERGNQSFLRNSVATHAAAFVIVTVCCAWLMLDGLFLLSGGVIIAVFAWCLFRSWFIPHLAAENPRAWTPKRVGMLEIIPTLVLGLASIVWLF